MVGDLLLWLLWIYCEAKIQFMLCIIKICYGIWFFVLLLANYHHLVLGIRNKFSWGQDLSILEDASVQRVLSFWRSIGPSFPFGTVIKDYQVHCTHREITTAIVKKFQMTDKKYNHTQISCCRVYYIHSGTCILSQYFSLKHNDMLASKNRCSYLPIFTIILSPDFLCTNYI